MPAFSLQALTGEAITTLGDGAQTRGVCYSDDLIEEIWPLLQSGSLGPVDDPKARHPGIAKRLLGQEPRVPIDEGLRRAIEDFRARLTRLEADGFHLIPRTAAMAGRQISSKPLPAD
jgi:nucleoside-diphosphate-sugar epimerase